ncbi:unnamed protein product [Amoebophrya sp. A120]|nr:unnamed protein product [Amoebophrya sp. A120]|eukprot:GSA120T00009860001.1
MFSAQTLSHAQHYDVLFNGEILLKRFLNTHFPPALSAGISNHTQTMERLYFPESCHWVVLIAVTWVSHRNRSKIQENLQADRNADLEEIDEITTTAEDGAIIRGDSSTSTGQKSCTQLSTATVRRRGTASKNTGIVKSGTTSTQGSNQQHAANKKISSFFQKILSDWRSPPTLFDLDFSEENATVSSTEESSEVEGGTSKNAQQPGRPGSRIAAVHPPKSENKTCFDFHKVGKHFRSTLKANGVPEYLLLRKEKYALLPLAVFLLAELLALLVLPLYCYFYCETPIASTTAGGTTTPGIMELHQASMQAAEPSKLHPETDASIEIQTAQALLAFGTLYSLSLLLYVWTTCRWALASFTLCSWSLASFRILLGFVICVLASSTSTSPTTSPSATSTSGAIVHDDENMNNYLPLSSKALLLAVTSNLFHLLRFPSIAQNFITVAVWWGVVVPTIVVLRLQTLGLKNWKKAVVPWLQANLSPFFLNVHLLNLGLAVFPDKVFDQFHRALSAVDMSMTSNHFPKSDSSFTLPDLSAGYFFAGLYGLFYNFILDNHYGVHFYLFLNLRTKCSCLFYFLMMLFYFLLFRIL